jgi:hypothetical protein
VLIELERRGIAQVLYLYGMGGEAGRLGLGTGGTSPE